MNDPAVEAAQRAIEVCGLLSPAWYRREMEAAAREALKTIREKVDLVERYPGLFTALEGEGLRGAKFFIDLIKPLIYTTEELKK